MSTVKVTVEVDPDEVRRHYAEAPNVFDPDIALISARSRFLFDIARQVYDALPPLPKFQPGDRVVRIRAGNESPNVGRIGTVTGEVDGDRLYVLMDGDTKAYQYDPDTLVRIVEDDDQ